MSSESLQIISLTSYFKEETKQGNVEDNDSPVSKMNDMTDDKISVIWKYMRYTGSYCNIVLLFIFLCIAQLYLNLSDYWVTLWSVDETFSTQYNRKDLYFLIFQV